MEEMYCLPDELLGAYIRAKGDAELIIENGVVTGLNVKPTSDEDLMAMAVDHEYRITLLELGITEEV